VIRLWRCGSRASSLPRLRSGSTCKPAMSWSARRERRARIEAEVDQAA